MDGSYLTWSEEWCVRKHVSRIQSWINVRPSSATLVQHWSSIGSKPRVVWARTDHFCGCCGWRHSLFIPHWSLHANRLVFTSHMIVSWVPAISDERDKCLGNIYTLKTKGYWGVFIIIWKIPLTMLLLYYSKIKKDGTYITSAYVQPFSILLYENKTLTIFVVKIAYIAIIPF